MRPPGDLAESHRRIDALLGSRSHYGARELGPDAMEQVRREAHAFLHGGNHKHLLAVVRDVCTARARTEPMLGPFSGTAGEHALFRLGAAAVWDMIERLAEPPKEEQP